MEFIGPTLISSFLILTILYSAYEKILDWRRTCIFYIRLYRHHFKPKNVILILFLIIMVEVIISSILSIGILSLLARHRTFLLELGYVVNSCLYLTLLYGLRVLKDYDGASRLGVYFLLSMFALYWIQSI